MHTVLEIPNYFQMLAGMITLEIISNNLLQKKWDKSKVHFTFSVSCAAMDKFTDVILGMRRRLQIPRRQEFKKKFQLNYFPFWNDVNTKAKQKAIK